MELKVLVAAARRGLALVLVSSLIGGAAAALAQRSMTQQYAASASLLLDPIAVLVAGQQPSFGDPERYVDAQVRLLGSAGMAERAAESLPGLEWQQIQQAVSLTHVTGSDVVEVTARAPSGEAASDIANALVTAYVQQRQEGAADARQSQVSAIEQRIADVEAQLVEPTLAQDQVSFSQQLLQDQLAALQAQLNSVVASDAVIDRTVVLDPATPPTEPDQIALPLLVAIGALVGALVGFALATLREYRAPRVVSAWHAEMLLGRPVAADFAGRRRRRGTDHATAGSFGRPTEGTQQAATALASALASAPSRGPRRHICVSSAAHEEGALEVARALSAALVRQGAVVALVMLSDQRDSSSPTGRPRAHDTAETHPLAPRWSAEPPTDTRFAVWRPNPSVEVPRLEDVHVLFTELPTDCDVVVTHAPPVLSSPLTAQIARESDELVIVVQVGAELEADVTRAVHTLRAAGADPHPVTYRSGRRARHG